MAHAPKSTGAERPVRIRHPHTPLVLANRAVMTGEFRPRERLGGQPCISTAWKGISCIFGPQMEFKKCVAQAIGLIRTAAITPSAHRTLGSA